MADAKKDRPTYAVDYIKGDFDKAVYLDNPHNDNLMATVLALAADLWTTRRRLMVVEKVLAEKNLVAEQVIESYNPSPADSAAWDKARDDFIRRTLSALTRETAKVSGTPPMSGMVPPVKR